MMKKYLEFCGSIKDRVLPQPGRLMVKIFLGTGFKCFFLPTFLILKMLVFIERFTKVVQRKLIYLLPGYTSLYMYIYTLFYV